jgi:hypothetical protein
VTTFGTEGVTLDFFIHAKTFQSSHNVRAILQACPMPHVQGGFAMKHSQRIVHVHVILSSVKALPDQQTIF